MKITSEIVKQSIINKLLEIAPQITVYKEAKTTPVYPHFFVYQISVSSEQKRNNYYSLDYLMNVRYRTANDPSTDLKLEQNLDSMSLKLLNEFNVIPFGDGFIRVTNKTIEKSDGVLHFNFNVIIQVKDIIASNVVPMNIINMNIEV